MALLKELGQWRWVSKAHARSSICVSLLGHGVSAQQQNNDSNSSPAGVCGGNGT